MLRMELPGKRKRGRPKRRFMDAYHYSVVFHEYVKINAK